MAELSPQALFDAHLHIIDARFPLQKNNGYLPPAFDCDDYRQAMSSYRLRGGAVVSGSFQGFDQTYLLAALRQLGPGYVGVSQLPASVTDEELLQLDRAGVRAVRFNLRRGGSAELAELSHMAQRVHELAGWHVELYVDSAELPSLRSLLSTIATFSIDHLGLGTEGFSELLYWAERGARVKATGFGRVNFDVAAALRDLYAANPQALMFGSDLPSTRAPRAYAHDDYQLVAETLGEIAAAAVYAGNALDFYRLAEQRASV